MWWIRARRAHTVLPAVLAAFVVLVFLVQNTFVALPSITGRSQVALSLFVPIPLVAGLMMCLEARLSAPEASGVRPVPLMDAALTTGTMGVALVTSVAAGLLLDEPQAGTAGRNALFLTGLMLCGRAVVGQTAAMIPVAWLLIVVFVGFRGAGEPPYPWTIVPEPAGALHAGIAAVLMFLAGIIVQLRTSRKTS